LASQAIARIVLAPPGIVRIAASTKAVVIRWPVIAPILIHVEVSIHLWFPEFEIIVIIKYCKQGLTLFPGVVREIGIISVFCPNGVEYGGEAPGAFV
jgi:hypothetical protein